MRKQILILCSLFAFVNFDAQSKKKEEIEIQEVVVTATRTERKLKDVPITTSVISSKTIEKAQMVNFKNFLEQELVGVNFNNHGGSESINIMGLGAKYILFLIDGERMAGETFDNIDYNRINLDNIERIEIVKGAASSLYGSNAIGGVINIITKKPKKNVEVSASARYGSFNEMNANIFIGTRQKWGSVSLSSTYKSRDPYVLKDKSPMIYRYENGEVKPQALDKTNVAGYYDYGVNPKATINITPKISLDLSSSIYFKERNLGDESSKKVRDQYQDYSNSGKLNIQFTDDKKMSISGSYGIYEKYDSYLLLRERDKKYENSIWRGSVIYDQKLLQKHSLVFGGEFLSEELLSFMFNNAGTGDKKNMQTYSAFAQQEWNWLKNFTLVTGARYDYHSEYKGQFTWRLSGMYKLGEHVTLRGGYAGGFRSPTLKELYTNWYHPYGGGFQIAGNTNLKVERSHNFNLSSDINFNRLNITVVGQYSNIKDKITSMWKAQSRDTLQYVNFEEARILSTEVSATYRVGMGISLKGGYAFTHDFVKEQLLTRPHTLTARVEYTPEFIRKYAPTLSFSGKYFSGLDVYNTDDSGKKYYVHYNPYSIWRLNLSLNLPLSLQATAGIDNIFGYRPKFSSSYSSISVGSTYFVGLKWTLR